MESELPIILGKELYKSKEQIERPFLARLQQKTKNESEKLCIDLEKLNKESKTRRNKLILEDVMKRRDYTKWLDSTSAALFSSRKVSPDCKDVS